MLSPITIRYPFRPVCRSLITGQVADLFGLDDTELPHVVAENVTLEAEIPDALPLNGWKTFDFRIAFRISGERRLKSVMLVRLNAFEELQVVVSGPQSEFGQASSAAMTCLRTWHKQ